MQHTVAPLERQTGSKSSAYVLMGQVADKIFKNRDTSGLVKFCKQSDESNDVRAGHGELWDLSTV